MLIAENMFVYISMCLASLVVSFFFLLLKSCVDLPLSFFFHHHYLFHRHLSNSLCARTKGNGAKYCFYFKWFMKQTNKRRRKNNYTKEINNWQTNENYEKSNLQWLWCAKSNFIKKYWRNVEIMIKLILCEMAVLLS